MQRPQLDVSQPLLTLRQPWLRTKSMSRVSGATSAVSFLSFNVSVICMVSSSAFQTTDGAFRQHAGQMAAVFGAAAKIAFGLDVGLYLGGNGAV